MNSVDVTSKLFEKLKVYNNYSNDCIFFKYIYDESDIDETRDASKRTADTDLANSQVFKAEYTHQIFGDDEIIFGYKNLRIDYYLTPGLLDAYIGISFKEKISPQRFDGIEPDDVFSAFTEFGCSPGFTRNLNIFRSEKMKQDLEFRPYGEKIHEYTRTTNNENSPNNGNNSYEIYKVDSSLPEFANEKFVDYILRVQTMLVYYIETSSFVDTDDPQWSYFLLYEKRKCPTGNGFRYCTIGYISVYNYYAYPNLTRSRISQMLIFPNYQRMGHGAELIESVYRDAAQNSQIIDVTAESPSEDFIKLRDYVTTRLCLSQLNFYKNNRSNLKCPTYTNELMVEALKKLKIPKLQSRRCYEILRLSATNQNNADEWTSYRLDVKKRLYLPFIRKSRYAKNAVKKVQENGQIESDKEEQQQPETSNKLNGKASALNGRFGGLNGRFQNGSIQEEDEEEGTTIGFGKPSTTFGKQPAAAPFNFIANGGKSSKSVSFMSNGSSSSSKEQIAPTTNGNGKKATSLNTSNSTTENSSFASDEENAEKAGAGAGLTSTLSKQNLFVSEKERKTILEEEFQESVQNYARVVKRLEQENLL